MESGVNVEWHIFVALATVEGVNSQAEPNGHEVLKKVKSLSGINYNRPTAIEHLP